MSVKGFQDTIDWYNKNASHYAKSIQNIAALRQMDEMISLLPKENKKILDAGCAAGRDSKFLFDKGVEVVGIDLSPELLKVAKNNYPAIEFIEGNFLHLPFKNETFGGIWAHASLLHFETVTDVLNSLKEFYRVLIKGGILHIYVKEQFGDKKFDVVTDKLSSHDRFFQYFTKEEVIDLMNKSGFTLVKIENEEDKAGRKEVRWIVSLLRK